MRKLALLLTAVLVAACGGPDAADDREAIQERVAAYVGAMLARDGKRACAQFTPAYRRWANERAGSCAEVLSAYGQALSEQLPQGFAEQASDPARIRVTLEGDRAEAALQVPGAGISVTRTTLQRVGERWLIDRLGVRRPRG